MRCAASGWAGGSQVRSVTTSSPAATARSPSSA